MEATILNLFSCMSFIYVESTLLNVLFVQNSQ